MNNMLRARLLRNLPSRKWVVEIPGIMLALNAMEHEPHGFYSLHDRHRERAFSAP